ncbi:ABC transporter ATP-binding protein [Kitasatospora sp. NRRL B-11411]|uniref:ATP-binding cassette domain-containing protein n=1 Tax=Kitasatospora sp. NRRL B-11411 TaxID=1463822 RepID=UPI00055E2696|nr:ABC transporter ATP-binding protein [Kitasatospora sp. NRRL B-11411]
MTSGSTASADPAVSDSELLLFGGPMRYSHGWAKHEQAAGRLSFAAVARQVPRFLLLAGRMAWAASPRALLVLVVSEVLRGIAAAASLIAVNRALAALLAPGDVGQVMRAAAPAVVAAGALAAGSAVLATLSTWAAGRLEPAVFRLATLEFLEVVSRSELAAIEDPEFLAEVDSARWGAMSLQNIIGQATAVLTGALSLVSVAGVLSVLNPLLLAMLVLITAPRGWGAVVTARRQYTSTRAMLQHNRASTALADMLIHPYSAAEQRVHASGPFLLHHYARMSAASVREQSRLARARATTDTLTAALAGLATAGAFALLGWLVLDHAVPLASAFTAVLAIRTGAAGIAGLVDRVNSLYEESLFVRDLDRLRTEGHRRAIPTGGTPLPENPKAITVEDVTFTYPGKPAPALDRVTLTIPGGQVTALVGANGSGKSTLAHLLCGVYQPQNGRIRWDGVDTADADRHQQFRSTVLLDQNYQRWAFTLEANLLLGRPEVPLQQEQLDASADYAGLQRVLDGLPHAWRTLLAKGFEGGVNLSGGQWQTIALARTHLRLSTPDADGRRPALVVVDEPTSALDPAAEIEAFEQIRRLRDLGATIILITHRLAATAKADHIAVLDHGRLVEQGTHAQLMADDTLYGRMYRLQAQQYDTTPATGRIPDQPRPATAP